MVFEGICNLTCGPLHSLGSGDRILHTVLRESAALSLVQRPASPVADSGNTPTNPCTSFSVFFKERCRCRSSTQRVTTTPQENTGKHRAFSVSLRYYGTLLPGGTTHSMLPRTQQLLDMHSSNCICAYTASLAIAAGMGNSVVPSVASRENKAV